MYTIPLQAQQDIVLEEYEQFDDYLEMVVQFGVSVYFTIVNAYDDDQTAQKRLDRILIKVYFYFLSAKCI